MREISLELLLGTRVVDSEGKKLGRIHEISAERGEESCLVDAYYVGVRGMLVRIAHWAVPHQLGSSLKSKLFHPYRIAWDEMDLSDPKHPRATLPREQLKRKR
ncbi:MAG TPA: hypothetical protein VM099_15715 [Gemmatimonadaceae bacterium]|nr:hypothetical protein [Gemmatimonadaceae bacterium]